MAKNNYEQLQEICFKSFVKRSEVRILISDLPQKMQREISDEIGKYCEEEITKLGKRLPDAKYLPTEYVFRYLEPYGISKKSILAKCKYYQTTN